MDIDFDHANHQFKGVQNLTYTNNSPDTINILFYHLYYNAFQPGSMMDMRSRTISDPDKRIGDRIKNLKENEIGYHRIDSLIQDNMPVNFEVKGTILKVTLNEPLQPGQKTIMRMRFNSQVPVQIRRTGRDNIEGIDYTMSQWYPKLAEYDEEGWHATPYVAREYHGVWGNYAVNINMDTSFTIAAPGRLLNAEEIGKGYGEKTKKSSTKKVTWQFRTNMVHDFVWTADRDYIHTTKQIPDGPLLHFFYQNDPKIKENWEALPDYTVKCFELMNKMVGTYPYSNYSVIQGGDGGMEYPMATVILGNGSLRGLVSVTVHEAIHSWFQGVLANNEGKYPWMDEGFNTYFNHIVMDSLFKIKNPNPHAGSYSSYFKLLESGEYEAISIHSDHYKTNKAYGVGSYSMGCVFLYQLQYIIGREAFEKTIKRYYNTWKFKHPQPNDFMRIAEKESGIQLDWYFNYFIDTDRKIDYTIKSVDEIKSGISVSLEKKGEFPMPVDISITLQSGDVYNYTIPLRMMMGHKTNDIVSFEAIADWPWTNPEYKAEFPFKPSEIYSIELDQSKRLADVNRENNIYPSVKN